MNDLTNYTNDEKDASNQLGTDPVEVYGERKAFADDDLMGLDMPGDEGMDMGMDAGAEAPPMDADMGMGEPGMEEELPIADPLQEKKDKLQAIIDDENTEKPDKDTAEEILASLEELGAAMQNADDFIAEKEGAAMEAGAEGEEGMPAEGEELPPAGEEEEGME